MFWIRSSEEEHRTFNPLVGISKFPESTLLVCISDKNGVVLSDRHMEPVVVSIGFYNASCLSNMNTICSMNE